MKRMKKTLDVGKILVLYDHENQPVTMACKAAETPNGRFVKFFYTPPNLRRKGYATACVAQLRQDILDSGKKNFFFFTGLVNPTSNSIYQKICHRPVINMDQ